MEITIKESSLEAAAAIHMRIPEFESYDLQYYRERCANSEVLVLAAFNGDIPAGYLMGYDRYKDGSFYCWMAGVVPEFRRSGVLNSMMNQMIKWARSKGYRKIKIKTRNSRREMLAYLVKNGFYIVRVSRREPLSETRILMEKDIR
jgi:ribosomal protein S18 acetylase RimI-like enzyme